MLPLGRGVRLDEVTAVQWFTRAAEQGHAAAQCSLGCCCEEGLGIAKDEVAAVAWYVLEVLRHEL